jgi:hypothetical protein
MHSQHMQQWHLPFSYFFFFLPISAVEASSARKVQKTFAKSRLAETGFASQASYVRRCLDCRRRRLTTWSAIQQF